jgi:hypothetical protein
MHFMALCINFVLVSGQFACTQNHFCGDILEPIVRANIYIYTCVAHYDDVEKWCRLFTYFM